jgi:hypothetical protein
MRRIVLSTVACLSVAYFSTLSHKLHDFLEKVAEHKMCVLIFSTASVEAFLIQRRVQRDTIINVRRSACNVPLFLPHFNDIEICQQI